MSEPITISSIATNVKKTSVDDVDKLLQLIMNEVTKIEKNEETDYGYTKMIFIALIMMGILLIKTKIYKISTCFKKRKKTENETLEKITIQEFNYNIIKNINSEEN